MVVAVAMVPLGNLFPEKISFNGRQRALDAGIIGRQESDEGNEKKARIEFCRPVKLHERILPRIESVVANLLMNRIANGAPAIEGTF